MNISRQHWASTTADGLPGRELGQKTEMAKQGLLELRQVWSFLNCRYKASIESTDVFSELLTFIFRGSSMPNLSRL